VGAGRSAGSGSVRGSRAGSTGAKKHCFFIQYGISGSVLSTLGSGLCSGVGRHDSSKPRDCSGRCTLVFRGFLTVMRGLFDVWPGRREGFPLQGSEGAML
jgi:hypothetical protein